jgi:hypothetical protein
MGSSTNNFVVLGKLSMHLEAIALLSIRTLFY